MKLKKLRINFEITVILLMAAYFIVFSYFSIQRYNAFVAAAYDLGVWVQTLWNAAYGNGFVSSIEPLPHFGIHVNLILFFIVPLYRLFESPILLLVLQSAFLALGAWPLYRLTVMKFKNKVTGLVFAVAYLLYPSLHNINLFDFHAVALAVPFLFFMFYFMEKQNYKWFFVFMVLALMCREHVAFIILFLSIYLFFVKKLRKIGLITLAISILWIILAFYIIIPSYGTFAVAIDNRYEQFGGSLPEIIYSIVTKPHITLSALFAQPKINYVLNLLSPVMFLPILSPLTLFIALPAFLQNMLSSEPGMYSSVFHYDSTIIPFVFIASVYGLHKVISVLSKKKYLKKSLILAVILIAVVFKSFFAFYHSSPLGPEGFNPGLYAVTEHHRIAKDVINAIPDDASVTTSTFIVPHVANRREVYTFGHKRESDYMLFDLSRPYPFSQKEFKELLDSYTIRADYELVLEREQYLLFRRITDE